MASHPPSLSSLPVIFITGGAGYIGSHFLDNWSRVGRDYFESHQLVILDDLSGGHLETIETLNQEMSRNYLPGLILERVDLRDLEALYALFEKYLPKAVIHFAGKISVAESVANPELYLQVNVVGSENLLQAMQKFECKKIVFSSTAAVYGNVEKVTAITEDFPLHPLSPYGHSKLLIEEAIQDCAAQWGLQAVIFRYFNAAGATLSGILGEWHEPETHLIPLLIESILKRKSEFKVFGNDYPTRDGTCVRDYIHVADLAHAHILGLARLFKNEVQGVETYNLGTENGTSVLEVIEAAKKVTKKEVKSLEFDRRDGDAAYLIASSAKAKKILGWEPIHSDIETILRTAFVWHQKTVILDE